MHGSSEGGVVQKTGSSLREAQQRMVGRGISSYGAGTFIIGGLSFCSRGPGWIRDDHIHGMNHLDSFSLFHGNKIVNLELIKLFRCCEVFFFFFKGDLSLLRL